MKIYPQKINAQNFALYGKTYNLKDGTEGVSVYKTQTFTDRMIEMASFGEGKVHLGMTEGSPLPCVVKSMEIHPTTEEAILCIGDPIILCVAPWEGKEFPSSSSVEAFELRDGQIAVLGKNVWHDACHGIERPTRYCWFAKACPEGLGWVDVDEELRLEFKEE